MRGVTHEKKERGRETSRKDEKGYYTREERRRRRKGEKHTSSSLKISKDFFLFSSSTLG